MLGIEYPRRVVKQPENKNKNKNKQATLEGKGTSFLSQNKIFRNNPCHYH
jgi:hypothetical protein